MWYLLLVPPALVTIAIGIGQVLGRQYIRTAIKSTPSFASLQRQGLIASMRNIWLIGLPLHYMVDLYVIENTTAYAYYVSLPVMIAVQSFVFYAAHYFMHHYLYSVHEFHHQFSQWVVPAAAMAVTVSEYLLAYALPVIVAILFARCDSVCLTVFLTLEYLVTTYIHCGFVKAKSISRLFLTPSYHCAHHKRYHKQNLAAPVFTLPDVLFDTQVAKDTRSCT
jgi:sterol desaturase/sphingolipid hydroxylase (fatty acid hydroxylase superfamily)